METQNLNSETTQITQTFLPIFSGFYNSIYTDDEYLFEGEAEHFNLPSNFPFYEYLNWNDYQISLSKYFCKEVLNSMSDFITNIDFIEVDSPKEYNFVNDKIDCNIKFKPQAISDYINANKDAFQKYLTAHFKSCDGFISFHSHDFEDWSEATNNFTDFLKQYIYLGSVLNFIAQNEEINEEIFMEFSSNVCISEFYNEEFDAIINEADKAIKFIQENYSKFSNDELINAITLQCAEHDNVLNMVQSAKDTINEIENNTLTIKF